MRTMELVLRQKLHSDRSKYLPPIKRGGYIDIYMTSSGQLKIKHKSINVLTYCRSDC